MFKKPILGLRIESNIRIAGVPTEHLFSLDPWFKTRQMTLGWHPCNSEIGFNPHSQDWFFEYESSYFTTLNYLVLSNKKVLGASERKSSQGFSNDNSAFV